MSTSGRSGVLLSALLIGIVSLAGCGSSQTRTVSVSSASTPLGVSTTQSAPTASTARTTTTPPATTTTAPAHSGAGSSRKAPAPAFAQQSGGAEQSAGQEGLGAAVEIVKAHGFTPEDTSEYHADQTLRVLVGTRSGSGEGDGQQAFFFVDGHYIGTDASEPSAKLAVVSQSDTEVTLSYPLYRPSDPICCPGGGEAKVQFQLNNGRLVPLQAIPPVSSASGLSRK